MAEKCELVADYTDAVVEALTATDTAARAHLPPVLAPLVVAYLSRFPQASFGRARDVWQSLLWPEKPLRRLDWDVGEHWRWAARHTAASLLARIATLDELAVLQWIPGPDCSCVPSSASPSQFPHATTHVAAPRESDAGTAALSGEREAKETPMAACICDLRVEEGIGANEAHSDVKDTERDEKAAVGSAKGRC